MKAVEEHRSEILRCIRCGFCVPVCPLYEPGAPELRSPRGKMILLQLVARGELAADSRLVRAFEDIARCGDCTKCTEACPAGLPVDSILKEAWEELEALLR